MTAIVSLLIGLGIGLGAWCCHAWWTRREEQASETDETEEGGIEVVDCDRELAQQFVQNVIQDVRGPLKLLAGGIGRELADLATRVLTMVQPTASELNVGGDAEHGEVGSGGG